MLKELFTFQTQISYFTDKGTEAQRYGILNFIKWDKIYKISIIPLLKGIIFGVLCPNKMLAFELVFILLYTEYYDPKEVPQGSQGKREEEEGYNGNRCLLFHLGRSAFIHFIHWDSAQDFISKRTLCSLNVCKL